LAEFGLSITKSTGNDQSYFGEKSSYFVELYYQINSQFFKYLS